MSGYMRTYHECIAQLLFAFLGMITRLKLLDEIEFDVSEFYFFNECVFIVENHKKHNHRLLSSASKIWIGILNGSRNTTQIMNFTHLTILARIFAFALSIKLRRAIGRSIKLKMTRNNIQRFSIIYFALIGFNIIEDCSEPFLRPFLMKLHYLVEKYIQITSIEDSFETKLFLIQFYIKSQVTLGILPTNTDHEKYTMLSKLSPYHLALSNIC
ncbi:hypothetical protein RF11_06970 [Thelohanellus kitauei]|uniref:Uncharacterized protein n=1 Tax=Thelohanellus kitauei TaxID=669202 RepID=A0A0C2M4I6_THEKT|nr:hypothetical protein RF11_06970 [Thelohanellus kitauei]